MDLLRTFLLVMLLGSRVNAADLKTVDERMAEFGEIVRQRLAPRFEAAGVPYPPERVALIGLKQECSLEVYAAGPAGEFRFICAYAVLAASGHLGPKLREGDKQVPEGIYRVRELNPNSRFHLSLWLDYPNEFDRSRAADEGRSDPGSEIMIHGDAVSSGCLAVGDPASEDLFVLAASTGIESVSVILSPVDLRRQPPPNLPEGSPPWTAELYQEIKQELARYQRD